MVAESARISRLVDDLRFLARSDASSVSLELRETDSHELMAALRHAPKCSRPGAGSGPAYADLLLCVSRLTAAR